MILLDADTLGQDISLSPLTAIGKLEIHGNTPPDVLAQRVLQHSIIITNKCVFQSNVILGCKNLRLICLTATGYNNIDLDACRSAGVAVCNVSDYCTQSVAQHTLAMAQYFLQKLFWHHNTVVSGQWSKLPLFTSLNHPFCEYSELRWGIIGLGKIGRRVAEMAGALGFKIHWSSSSGNERCEPWPQLPLADLLKHSDVVSLHCPLTEQTRGLISAQELAFLSEGSILLNLSRGAVVNETDLIEALKAKELYVGLDVFSTEPLPEGHPFIGDDFRDRLLLTPHVAWAARQARQRVVTEVARNIQAFETGQRRNRVD